MKPLQYKANQLDCNLWESSYFIKHLDPKVKHQILRLFPLASVSSSHQVSSLYMDPSIGNYIKVVVVKIIFVEDLGAAPELEVTTDADTTLTSFCRWQQQLNPDDDANPHHHDVAILITRQDICSQHGNPCRYGWFYLIYPAYSCCWLVLWLILITVLIWMSFENSFIV